MGKIEEAQQILKDLGLPKQQQNKISALTLLALAGIKESDKWNLSTNKSLTLSKDIIEFVDKYYNIHYKTGTRESFRKIALRPFVNYNIALLNPDDSSLKTNSSKTHYALSDLALNAIKQFKTGDWQKAIDYFKTYQSSANILEIKNFKSIKHIKIEISRINIFIGKPNSGKSNLLEALTLFNFIEPKKSSNNEPGLIRYNAFDNIFYDRNLNNVIEIKLNEDSAVVIYQESIDKFVHIINPSLDFLQAFQSIKNVSWDEIQKNISILSKGVTSSKYEVLTNEGNVFQKGEISKKENSIRRYEFKDGVDYGDLFSNYLKSHGENLFAIVQKDSSILNWINSFYNEYNLEFLIDFSSKKFEIQKKQNGVVYKIPFELTPDTFRRMLFHVSAIHSNKKTTILFEEPESHSFPPYVKELSELIKNDKSNTYFITTHSPYFFNSMVEDSKRTKDISFFHVYYEDYQTQVKKLTNKDLDNVWGSGADVFFNIDSINK